MKQVMILNDKFPSYLRELYQDIQALDHSRMIKRVGVMEIAQSPYYKLVKNKIAELFRLIKNGELKDTSDKALHMLNTDIGKISWLQRPKNVTLYLSAPANGPYVDDKDKCTFGSFICHNTLPYLRLKKRVKDEVESMFPHLAKSLSKLLTISRLTADTPDLPSLSVIDTRREIGLDDGPLTMEEANSLDIFVNLLLDDWIPDLTESARWHKKDSSIGLMSYVIDNNELIYDKITMNRADGHAIVKKKQLEYFVNHIDEIKQLLQDGNLSKLLYDHNILFQSRVIKRDQADTQGKERYNVTVDSYYSGTLTFQKADLTANLYLLKKLDHDKFYGNVYQYAVDNGFQGVRVRATYGGEHGSLCYPIATTQSMRNHFKNKFPKVFKFGSDDYLLEIVNNARKNIKILTSESVELIAIDNVRFDHTPKLGYLARIFNKIAEKDNLTGLILALQAICPVAIGSAGYSKMNHSKIENIILGNPLDYKTFFFGQGKSGDPDVADRCKILCAWNLAVCVLKALGLEYNKENLIKLLNHELAIAFLNLGDNNLILCPPSLITKLKECIESSTILKAALEEDAIFGGKLFTIESDDSISLEKSPISLLDKLLTPEEPFGIHGKIDDKSVRRKGWSAGMKMRRLEAEEQLAKYNKSSSVEILDLLDKLWKEELGSSSLSDLTDLYEPEFRRYEYSESQLFQKLYNSNDWQAKYLLLDQDSIHYKVDIDDLSDDIKQIYFESIGSAMEQDTIGKMKKIIGGEL